MLSIITNENEVSLFLAKIKEKLKNNCDHLVIAFKDGENKSFLMEYALLKEDIRQMVLSLEQSDFSEKMENINPRFDNFLYLFAPYCQLVHKSGTKITVQLYLKIVYSSISNKVIIVSIHLPKWKLNYCFN